LAVSADLFLQDVTSLDPATGRASGPWDITVRQGVITAMEPSGRAPPPQGVPNRSGRDKLLLPGLVNAHTHSPLNLLKGTGDVLSHPAFMWMNQADTVGRTPDEIRLVTLLGCIEHLLSGTTSLIDHFPEQGFSVREVEAVVDAYEHAGMRALVALRMFDEPYDDIAPPGGLPVELEENNPLRPPPLSESLALVEEAIGALDGAGGGRVRLCPGPSNPGRCSDALLTSVQAMAERRDTPVHVHLLETRIQAELASARYGRSMVAHLDEIGLLTNRLSCAHTIWLDRDDIALMSERGAIAVHNPESNLKLGSGISPVSRMLAAGMTVALGTDGASTNDNLDMHEVMRIAVMLQRPFEADRSRWPTAGDALRMATTSGAAAMRRPGLGTLAVGAPADFVLHDLDTPFWTPLTDPLAQLVFGASAATVHTVVVAGRVLVEEGRFTAFDPAPILAEARSLSRHLSARNAKLRNLVGRVAASFP
jgi:5-methylthioadenosine/S-adenosylhomocysteine deaminase